MRTHTTAMRPGLHKVGHLLLAILITTLYGCLSASSSARHTYPKAAHPSGDAILPHRLERAPDAIPQAAVHAPLPAPAAKIQVALLLDVSNSMDGLLHQAKAQLWDLVNLLGNARCQGVPPAFELALYEYGRPTNGAAQGYIRRLHAFTTQLDQVSATLFGLETNGGEEHCPQVILTSLQQLGWDEGSQTYKVIFIAGNETFRQGPISWSTACDAARSKGVVVNTIYCGSREQGIREFWNLGAECGNGSYTHIDHNAVEKEVPTPYDSLLFVLNDRLNTTYIAYGSQGNAAAALQKSMDQANYSMSTAAAARRVEAKGKANVYRNAEWDLVDALEDNPGLLTTLPKTELPEALQGLSPGQVNDWLNQKKKERQSIQKQIADLSQQRNAFLKKMKTTTPGAAPTLATEMERMIKAQAARYNMVVE